MAAVAAMRRGDTDARQPCVGGRAGGLKLPPVLTLEQLRSNRNALFWTLNGAGWAAYGIAQYFGTLLIQSPRKTSGW